MPAPSIVWELVRAADMGLTRYGLRVYRGLMVKNAPLVVDPTYAADPSVLLKCLGVSGFPLIGSTYPDAGFPWLLLAETNVMEVVSKTTVKFRLKYQGIDPSGPTIDAWVVHEDYTVSVVQTQATADGSKNIEVWYKKGSAAATSLPAGGDLKVLRAHKFIPRRTIKAIALMTRTVWNTKKAAFRALAGKINAATWQGDARGTWLFLGPRVTTRSLGEYVTVELNYMFEPQGFYALEGYLDPHGNHPSDSIKEQALRAIGLPAVNDLIQRNGLSLCSVQGEGDFSIFTFTL